jgi:Zn-dependent protease with chaperone function
MAMNNPVLPVSFELVAIIPVVIWAALVFAALLTIAKSTQLTAAQRVLWTIAVILLPVAGSAAWLISYWIERRQAGRASTTVSGGHFQP